MSLFRFKWILNDQHDLLYKFHIYIHILINNNISDFYLDGCNKNILFFIQNQLILNLDYYYSTLNIFVSGLYFI